MKSQTKFARNRCTLKWRFIYFLIMSQIPEIVLDGGHSCLPFLVPELTLGLRPGGLLLPEGWKNSDK